MGTDVMDDQTVGSGCVDIGNVLHHRGYSGNPLQAGTVGHVHKNWEDAGRFSPLGDTTAYWEDATVNHVQDMGVSSPGVYDGDGGVGNSVVGYLRRSPSE